MTARRDPTMEPKEFLCFNPSSPVRPRSSRPAQLPDLLRGDGRKPQCVLGGAAHSQRTAGGLQGRLPAHRSCARYAHKHTHKHECTGRRTPTFLLCVRAGVSKVVTVDVRGSWQRWLKVRDLVTGATYAFSAQALTVSYGPPIRANISAQPAQGSNGPTTDHVISCRRRPSEDEMCVCVPLCGRRLPRVTDGNVHHQDDLRPHPPLGGGGNGRSAHQRLCRRGASVR